MHTRHPDEETLYAFTDGELTPEVAGGVAQHIEACADCASRVAEARGVAAAATRIVGALDTVPANVIPARSPRRLPPWLLAAAVVVLAVGVSSVVIRDADEISRSPASLAAIQESEEAAGVADAAAPGGTAVQNARVPDSPGMARVRAAVPPAPASERGEAVAQAAAGTTAGLQQVADGRVPAGPAPPPPTAGDMAGAAAPPAAPRAMASQKQSERVASEITVTGAGLRAAPGAAARESATAATATTDLTAPLRVTRYRVNPEVVIELREFGAEPPATTPPAGSAEYRWRDAAGSRVYALTGPLPPVELEALARRLGELAIVR